MRQEPLSSLLSFLKTGESWIPQSPWPKGSQAHQLCSLENRTVGDSEWESHGLPPNTQAEGTTTKEGWSAPLWMVVVLEGGGNCLAPPGKVLRYKMRVQLVQRECSIAPLASHVQRVSTW